MDKREVDGPTTLYCRCRYVGGMQEPRMNGYNNCGRVLTVRDVAWDAGEKEELQKELMPPEAWLGPWCCSFSGRDVLVAGLKRIKQKKNGAAFESV